MKPKTHRVRAGVDFPHEGSGDLVAGFAIALGVGAVALGYNVATSKDMRIKKEDRGDVKAVKVFLYVISAGVLVAFGGLGVYGIKYFKEKYKK